MVLKRIKALEKKVADLERQLSERPINFVPEDSDGIRDSRGSISIAPQTTIP